MNVYSNAISENTNRKSPIAIRNGWTNEWMDGLDGWMAHEFISSQRHLSMRSVSPCFFFRFFIVSSQLQLTPPHKVFDCVQQFVEYCLYFFFFFCGRHCHAETNTFYFAYFSSGSRSFSQFTMRNIIFHYWN